MLLLFVGYFNAALPTLVPKFLRWHLSSNGPLFCLFPTLYGTLVVSRILILNLLICLVDILDFLFLLCASINTFAASRTLP